MRLLLPGAGHIAEFATDPASGRWLTGTCGETAYAVARGCTLGQAATQANMAAIYDDMARRGLVTNPNGASTLAGIAAEARASGVAIAPNGEYDYQGDTFPGVDWVGLLRANAGHQPMVLQLARGGLLADIVSGVHDETGVDYHFIAIVGVQDGLNGDVPAGYLCADGDNPAVSGGFQLYSRDILQAALPCALLILAMPTITQGATTMAIRTGWTDVNGVITDPNGRTLTQGFAQYLRDNDAFAQTCGPLATEPYHLDIVGGDPSHGAGDVAIFTGRALCWTPNDAVPGNRIVHPYWVGAMHELYRNQLAAAQQQVAQLTEELAAAKAAPPLAPTPAPTVDPQTVADAQWGRAMATLIAHAPTIE